MNDRKYHKGKWINRPEQPEMNDQPRYEVTINKGKESRGFFSLTGARLYASRYLPGFVSIFDTQLQVYLYIEDAQKHLGTVTDVLALDPNRPLFSDEALPQDVRRELNAIRKHIVKLRSEGLSLDDCVREARREWLTEFLFKHPVTSKAA